MSLFDDEGDPAPTRDRVAPEPEIYLRAKDAETDLDRVANSLIHAEEDLKKAAQKRDDLQFQIAEWEQRAGAVRDEATSDALSEKGEGIDLGNKEKRDAHVALRLRENENYQRLNRQVQSLKTELRNAVTDYELAQGRVKSLHRRCDAAVTKARLIGSQLQTLGYLQQYDTAKLQLGAQRR